MVTNMRKDLLLFFCLAFFLPRSLAAQWPRNPNVNLAINNENFLYFYYSAKASSDTLGNSSFFYWMTSSQFQNVKLQYATYNGILPWGSNAVYVLYDPQEGQSQRPHSMVSVPQSVILELGRTGAIFITTLQRINFLGERLWGEQGVTLQSGVGYTNDHYLIDAGNGQYIDGYFWELVTVFADLYAQKFDTSGTLLWGPEGVVVCDAPEQQTSPTLVSDGQGGAIFLWNDNRNSIFDDIYAQRLDADGNRLWDPAGVPVAMGSFDQSVEDILEDGQGGAFFSFVSGSGYNPRAGRINGAGQILWDISFGVGNTNYGGIQLAADSAGGFYAVWSEYPDSPIYAQHLNASGQSLWVHRLTLSHSPGVDDYYKVVEDNAGGFICVWQNDGTDNIYAQHVTSGADLLWGLSDVVVCSEGSWQWYPRALPDGSGGVVASWADWRNPGGANLYGQRVLSNGILGNFPELELRVTPLDTPIVIPPSGGRFRYQISIRNFFGSPLHFDFWTDLLAPDGALVGPLLLRQDILIPAGGTLNRTLTQSVPGGALSGQYLYRVHVGDYPVATWDQGSFLFTKLGADAGSDGEWICSGWETISGISTDQTSIPTEFTLYPAFPNPFNPATTITFGLPVASWVKVEVFDIAGRIVRADLKSAPTGWYEAGVHELTFDGSDLPSGIYILRLQGGDFSAVKKLILLK